MKYLHFLVLSFFFISTFAQEFELKGTVIDDTNLPLDMASVSIFEGDELVEGGLTDFDGNFSFYLRQGEYRLVIEYTSFETKKINLNLTENKDLGTIRLVTEITQLDEIEVVVEKTEVEVKLDKKIYNIGKDLTISGGTIADALNNVPSVSADVDGTISLRGNENVRILINGKPSTLAGFGDADVLQQLPAESIERVEVIASPSARYDAEGTAGIINIVLKRDKTLGYNGSAQVNLGTPMNNGVTVNGNVRTEKFNFFNTTTYSKRRPPGNAFFDNTFTSGAFDRITENRFYNRDQEDLSVNLGAQYFITDYESITATAFLRPGERFDYNENITNRFIEGEFDSRTSRDEFDFRDDDRYQVSLNYENQLDEENRDHKLTIDGQVSWRKRDQNIDIIENQFGIGQEEGFLLAQEEIIENRREIGYLLQGDYTLPIGEDGQFEAGFRGDLNDNKTIFDLSLLNTDRELEQDDLSNQFDYQENVGALYTQYGNKIGENFSYLLGLRYEYTQLKGNTTPLLGESTGLDQFFPDEDVVTSFDNRFSNFFPTVNMIYKLDDTQELTLGFNRRINRPRSWFINPFPSRTSRTNIFQGNPSLQPAFSNAFDIGHLKRWDKFTLTSSIFYQRETDSFERIQEDLGIVTEDGINVIINRPINLSTNDRIGGEIGGLYNPSKKVRLNGSFNFFRFESRGEFRGQDFGATNLSFFGRISSRVELPWGVNWQTNGFWFGPRENAQTKTESILSLDLALSKDILNDNATVSLNVRDVFNSRKRIAFTDTPLFTSQSEFQWRERQITLTFVYRFNQQKNERDRRGRNGNGGGFDDEGGF